MPFLAALGCNAIIGADDPTLVAADGGGACVLNSDCTSTGQVCIFRVCSPPCHVDKDCAAASRCLQTQLGTACVANAVATCDATRVCPSGATCENGACRDACGQTASCLGGQQCVAGACVGTDPSHDFGVDAGGAPSSSDAGASDATAPQEGGVTPDATADAGGDGSEEAGEGTDGTSAEVSMDAPSDTTVDADASAQEATTPPSDASSDVASGVCTAGARQCVGLQPQICINGAWTANGAQCSFVCDAAAGCVGVCAPGTKQCMNTTPQTCDTTGTWQSAAMPCPSVCSNGDCAGSCVPGTMQCNGSTPQTCTQAGAWMDGTPCSGATPVCSGGSCVACTTGTQCSNNIVQTCVSDTWQNQAPCSGTTPVCVNGACAECTTGSQCANNVVQTCVANHWQNQTTCSGATPACANATCVACTTGTQCSNNVVQTCVNDAWQDQTTCTGTTPACANGMCVECTTGTQCSNNMVQTCVNNAWQTQTTCTSTQVCRSGGCVNAVHDVGWPNATSSTLTLSGNILYLFRLPALANSAILNTFGVVGTAAGTAAKLVLYADNGSGTAPSGAAVAATSNPLNLVSGAGEQTASPGNVMLSAGTVYWLGIVVNATTTISATADSSIVALKLSESFTAVPPWPSGSGGSTGPADDPAIYINVQDTN
ncbi:MAG TPA: hypothetical protein VKU41_12675 [Polyangiaceae bacterium]|nr:hypothetical protein [Polyangiaceae bacterium]